MTFTNPDKSDPVDLVAHVLSELYNDNAPLGWERYKGAAETIVAELRSLPCGMSKSDKANLEMILMNDSVYLKVLMSIPNIPEHELAKMKGHIVRADNFAARLGLDIKIPEGL